MKKEKVIVLRGPTASGKTEISLKLTQIFPLEIISVDSVMVYKKLNIGSAKPTKDILEKHPHHLIDMCEPSDKYSVGRFIVDANKSIKQIHSLNKIPILVGGTMMYHKVLQDGLSKLPPADDKIRYELDLKAKSIGWSEMHKELKKVDPESALNIKANDRQRIQRGLEVFIISGIPLSKLNKEESKNTDYNFINISLIPDDRDALYKNIESRFDSMIKIGLYEEIRKLLDDGDVCKESHSMQSIGYREIVSLIQGKITKEEAINSAKQSSRRYAKRQITWLRSMDDQYKVKLSDTDMISTIKNIINQHFEIST